MDKYYDGSFVSLEDPSWSNLIDVRPRSYGRTSFWVNKGIKRAEKNPKKRFIYFRRSERELDEVVSDGFGKNILLTDYYGNWYKKKGYTIEVSSYKVYLVKNDVRKLVGYLKAFNTIKGVDLNDVDFIIFDEFIALLRSQYKGGSAGAFEPNLFNVFIHTVFRRRKGCHVVMLGNQDATDSTTNPYNEYYKIPYKAQKFRRDDIGLIYRRGAGADDDESTASKLSKANARDFANAVSGEALDRIDSLFIAQKTPNAEYMCAIKYQTTFLTLWLDVKTGIIYVSDKYKVDNLKPFYVAFSADMTVNTSLLIASQYPQLKAIKAKFYTNQIRYNNGNTADKMFDVIDVIKQ